MKVPSCGRRRAVRTSSSLRGRPTAGWHSPQSGPQPDRSAHAARGPARPGPAPLRAAPAAPPRAAPAEGREAARRERCPAPLPHSPFFKERGKKIHARQLQKAGISSRTLRSEQRASLDPFRGHEERGWDQSHKRKQRATPSPPKRPPPRALRAARATRSHPAPTHTKSRTQAAPHAPAGSRELPQLPPHRPFIAVPISRGDGRGAPGPFLPFRLPGPPAGAAWLGTTRPHPIAAPRLISPRCTAAAERQRSSLRWWLGGVGETAGGMVGSGSRRDESGGSLREMPLIPQ